VDARECSGASIVIWRKKFPRNPFTDSRTDDMILAPSTKRLRRRVPRQHSTMKILRCRCWRTGKTM